MNHTLRVLAVAAIVLAAACRPGGVPESELAPSCGPHNGTLAPDFDVASLAGRYNVLLSTELGDSAGALVSGTMSLMAYPDSLRRWTTP